MIAQLAHLALPHWLHWLAYLPAAVAAAALCLIWPAELLLARLFPGRACLGEWPDDYDVCELAQLTEGHERIFTGS